MKERHPMVYIVFLDDTIDSVHCTQESACYRYWQLLKSEYCLGFVDIEDFEVENLKEE